MIGINIGQGDLPGRVQGEAGSTMKIARYSTDGGPAYGILEDTTLDAASGDLFGGLTRGEPVGDVMDVKLLAPLDPGKIVCIGLNYALHAKESGVTELPKEPVSS